MSEEINKLFRSKDLLYLDHLLSACKFSLPGEIVHLPSALSTGQDQYHRVAHQYKEDTQPELTNRG